jgi:hypothetical protein
MHIPKFTEKLYNHAWDTTACPRVIIFVLFIQLQNCRPYLTMLFRADQDKTGSLDLHIQSTLYFVYFKYLGHWRTMLGTGQES